MPVGVDDVLVAMAVAAAQAIGTDIAKSMLRSSTAYLATKEDVERAVDQIESFVHQEFLEAEARGVASDIDTVVMNLAQYEKSELRKDLLQSQQLLDAARARGGISAKSAK